MTRRLKGVTRAVLVYEAMGGSLPKKIQGADSRGENLDIHENSQFVNLVYLC